MVRHSIVTIKQKQDFYNDKVLVKPIAEELCKNFANNGMDYITRKDLLNKVEKEHVVTTASLRTARHINKDGTVGDTYLRKAGDIAISCLRNSGCLLDRGLGEGRYFITKDINRYLTTDLDNHIDEMVYNLKKKVVKNLPKEYARNNLINKKAI